MIQDISPHRLDNAFKPGKIPGENDMILIFRDRMLLCGEKSFAETGKLVLPLLKQIKDPEVREHTAYAFCIDRTEYYIYIGKPFPDGGTSLTDDPGFVFINIIDARRKCDNLDGMIVFTGIHLHQWYQSARYCGSCAGRMQHDKQERAMWCPVCGRKEYPRLFPAVIVGVKNGEKLLVTKYREGFAPYALIAGFAEIGETLEETVEREVQEEVGLKVKNIRYYGSQPWGIAQDILAGFFCEADGDTHISMDSNELKLAVWKNREEIELQPDSFSLTNEMMRAFKCGEI